MIYRYKSRLTSYQREYKTFERALLELKDRDLDINDDLDEFGIICRVDDFGKETEYYSAKENKWISIKEGWTALWE